MMSRKKTPNPQDDVILRNEAISLYAATQSQLFVHYRAVNTWNSLSGNLRSSSSLCTFKKKLRQLYLSLR